MKLKSLFSIFLILTLIISCCGCSVFKNEPVTKVAEEEVTKPPEPALNLAVLKNNAATLGLLELMKNAEENKTNYNVSISNNESEIIKLLDEGKIDVATLPLITAIRYHNTGKTPIKMLYSASYMTVKILSDKNDIKSVYDFGNKPIYTPGQKVIETASLMQLIYTQQIAYRDHLFMPDFKYAKNPDHLLKIINSGSANYLAVSEPLATLIMDKHPNMNVSFDPSKESAISNMVQDCVVITEKYINDNPEAVENFMTRCKTSIVYSNYNTYSAAELAELYQIVETSDLATKMIQNSKLIFVNASVAEKNNSYLTNYYSSLITDFQLYDGYPPESDFYYR